ncbi:MAG: NUDIX domain-containing protein [Limisphaerales bacterium]
MKPADLFRHCPQCGKASPVVGRAPFHCAACGFLFYFNPAIAVGAILQSADGRVLLVRRARQPHQGKLTVPGGFVDIRETAEDALRREIREEVSLHVARLDYFCSLPNEYHYRGVTYQVLDFFFTGQAPGLDAHADPSEVTEICWLHPTQIELDQIAFPSVRRALEQFFAGHLPKS